jgi:predicted ATPase/DNA-binding CsgD family transcriptional regulator
MGKQRLPQTLTPFIGRRNEIGEIGRRLADPSCRLCTLLGSGGVGKTRLAIEVARLWPESGDVAFVALQPLRSPELIVAAVADALGLALPGADDPEMQLLHYLRDRTALLVLDNFEHLLEGAEFLSNLLQRAPGVKLLVTSRASLNLQEEWIYPVAGLPFPRCDSAPEGDHANPAEFDAVRLFASCVERIRPDFPLQAEMEQVLRVCRLVEGTPLALELAAAWAKTLTIAAIADEIEQDLGFLATSVRNVEERHRSMQAVFERSWQLLTPPEQSIFQQMSVFRGGFDRAAAVAVCGASLPRLAALLDKSLLRWQPDGRYQVHELLRQFAADRLAQNPELLLSVRDAHCTCYLRFLGDRFDDLTQERQQEALAEIVPELDNIRSAWQWAVDHGRMAELEHAAMALHTFCQYQSRFSEGAEMLGAARATVEAAPASCRRDIALAVLLNCSGWLEMRFGRVQAAVAMQQQALALYEKHGRLPTPGTGTDPLTALSVLAVTCGDYGQAVAHGLRAWERAAARIDRRNQAFAGYGLTSAAVSQGHYETALQQAIETLALTKAIGNRWFMAYVYNQLGDITQALGDRAAARDYYRLSFAIREEFNDPEGMAVALGHLGELALGEEAYGEAHELYQRSLAFYRNLGDRGGLVRTLHGLAVSAHQMGDTTGARHYFQEALQIAAELQAVPLTLSLLVGVAAFLIGGGVPDSGMQALTLVANHPASERVTRERARQLQAQAGRPPAAAAVARGDPPANSGLDLETELNVTLNRLLIELASERAIARAALLPPAVATATRPQQLPDPLSERELEVLQLIAGGATNPEIAAALTVALSTVKTHVNNIYGKLGVSHRVQAINRARELNLV